LIPGLIGVLVLAGFFGRLFVSRANIAQFYPTSCLGGWQNPQNASGKPDLEIGAREDEFNAENSAFLGDVISQIFCGGFEGETPADADLRRAVLKFSWRVGLKNGAAPAGAVEPNPADQTVPAATEENGGASPSDSSAESPPAESPVPPGEAQPEETPPENTDSSRRGLILKVFAQELPPEVPENVPESALEESPASGPAASFLEVVYTTDGTNWRTLGEVDLDNWRNLELEIPDFQWEHLPSFQVGLKSISPASYYPAVYLDGMWLEIDYEENPRTEEAVPPEESQQDAVQGDLLTEEAVSSEENRQPEKIIDGIKDSLKAVLAQPGPPEKKWLFAESGPAVPSDRYLGWQPDFEKMKKANFKINAAAIRPEGAEDDKIVFEGVCGREYFVILGYLNPEDYKNNPAASVYNKAFPCEGGRYRYELSDFPEYLREGTYYFLVAEQGRTGFWHPISAVHPVRARMVEE
jgi:hypothetical protein